MFFITCLRELLLEDDNLLWLSFTSITTGDWTGLHLYLNLNMGIYEWHLIRLDGTILHYVLRDSTEPYCNSLV